MFNLQITNPFVCHAFVNLQKQISSSLGEIGKIKPYSNIAEYQSDMIVFEYVPKHSLGKEKLWSFCRKNGMRIVSFDEMYSYLDLHMITIGLSHDPNLLRKFFIKYSLPKCLVRCEESILRNMLGNRIEIIKIDCDIDYNEDGSVEIYNKDKLFRSRFEIAYNNNIDYALFFTVESTTTCFNEPSDILEVYSGNMKSLKANKHHNNFTIVYSNGSSYNKYSGSDSTRSYSSIIEVMSFRDLIRSVCEVVLAQYNMRKNNVGALFTENNLNSRQNYDKHCVEISFKAAITKLYDFKDERLIQVESICSFMELKHVSPNLLAIGIGAALLNKKGVSTAEIEDLFLQNASSLSPQQKNRFTKDISLFVKSFGESYISHVFELMRFSFIDDPNSKLIIDDRSSEEKSINFRIKLFVILYEFMNYELANKIERLTKEDENNMIDKIDATLSKIDADFQTKISDMVVELVNVTNSEFGPSFFKQLVDAVNNINDNGYVRKRFEIFLFKEIDGKKMATTKKTNMFSSNVDTQIQSQHGVGIISKINQDYITKPVDLQQLGIMMGLANGACGSKVAEKIIPFDGWALSENDTLCACVKRANDTLVTFTARLLHTVKQLGLSTESIATVANPILELFDFVDELHSRSKSHQDIKIDNFLVLPPKEHKKFSCADIKDSNDIEAFIDLVDKLSNNTNNDLFSIGVIDLAESLITTPKLYNKHGRKMTAIYPIKTVSLAIASLDMLHGMTSIEAFDYYAVWLLTIGCGLILPLIALNNNGSLLRLNICMINDDLKNYLTSPFTFLLFVNKYVGGYFLNKDDLRTVTNICWELKREIVLHQRIGTRAKALYLQLLTKTCEVGLGELKSVKPKTLALPKIEREFGYATDENLMLKTTSHKKSSRMPRSKRDNKSGSRQKIDINDDLKKTKTRSEKNKPLHCEVDDGEQGCLIKTVSI